MSTWNEAFPSQFYKASDLADGPKVLTVSEVHLEPIGDEGKEKPVIYFQGEAKALACNRTNADVLEQQFGPERGAVIGKRIKLFGSTVRMQGRVVPCIRVAIPQEEKPAVHGGSFDSDVTF
jgi:hypothetical protein